MSATTDWSLAPASDIARAVSAGTVGARDVVAAALDRIARIDPAVNSFTDCLLGRGPHFAPGMYSCLAGFVEPGETIENAVRRETLEESGIRTGRIRYHASQPWPMPHTLMIGCYAEAKSRDITRDEQELEDCRWFTREETIEMLERPGANGSAPPPKGAIAHRLMRDWVEWKK